MASVAEEAGLMVVTDEALAKRAASGFEGETDAQFQYPREDNYGLELYIVECYDQEGYYDPESRYLVQLLDDVYLWAACTCKWFRDHYSRRTTCRHIYAAVEKHRKRHHRRAAAKAA